MSIDFEIDLLHVIEYGIRIHETQTDTRSNAKSWDFIQEW